MWASMRFSSWWKTGPDREVAFQGFERFLHGDELNVVLPEFRRIVAGQIGAQQITALAASDLSQLFAIERKGQLAGLTVDFGLDQTPGGGRLGAGTVRNLVCGAILTPMEGAYGNQEGHPGRFAGGV